MRLLGEISYVRDGDIKCASSSSDVRIDLRGPWVMVGRPDRGTELVGWDAVRSLCGWAPVPTVEQRLTEPTFASEKLCDSADVASSTKAKSHQTYGHCSQVSESTSTGERRADEEDVDG